ncbi:hypothetical protein CA265_10975 [Sphingobacteriaceae bacterium GW460-11-11-14-LB5]|nr:hypothetical protein CA265_10975 [Sphingobacteriaceae bacterium GW460-11-11-14-LB5]
MLTNINKVQALPKNFVNPKWQKNQKNSCRIEQIALPNLKRSGFVFNNHDSQLLKDIEHKTKCRCFFDKPGAVRSHLAGLTKRFGYFGAPKYHAPAAESGKNNDICDHKIVF